MTAPREFAIKVSLPGELSLDDVEAVIAKITERAGIDEVNQEGRANTPASLSTRWTLDGEVKDLWDLRGLVEEVARECNALVGGGSFGSEVVFERPVPIETSSSRVK